MTHRYLRFNDDELNIWLLKFWVCNTIHHRPQPHLILISISLPIKIYSLSLPSPCLLSLILFSLSPIISLVPSLPSFFSFPSSPPTLLFPFSFVSTTDLAALSLSFRRDSSLIFPTNYHLPHSTSDNPSLLSTLASHIFWSLHTPLPHLLPLSPLYKAEHALSSVLFLALMRWE
jgi:hypothetical protein